MYTSTEVIRSIKFLHCNLHLYLVISNTSRPLGDDFKIGHTQTLRHKSVISHVLLGLVYVKLNSDY